MPAIERILVIERGSVFRYGFRASQPNRAPVDLTGCTARMQIRDYLDRVVAELTTENGGIALGGSAGTALLYLSAQATAALTGEGCIYDLEIIPAVLDEANAWKLARGQVRIKNEVTR